MSLGDLRELGLSVKPGALFFESPPRDAFRNDESDEQT
jgi:hypothetical protein